MGEVQRWFRACSALKWKVATLMQSARLLKKGKQQLEEIKDSESKEIDSKHIENEYSDDESDGDNENFMEDRIEGTGDISKHNLSAHKAPGWS